MKPLQISINQLARDLDVPPNRISAIVNRTRSITADTALRLGTYFNISPKTWLGLQVDYDLRLIRRQSGDQIIRRVRAGRAARSSASLSSGHGIMKVGNLEVTLHAGRITPLPWNQRMARRRALSTISA